MRKRSPLRTPDTQLFHDVFNASPMGIAVENLDGKPLFVNPALCLMLGFSAEEMRTKHCVQFSPPEDSEKDWILFQQLREGSIDRYQIEKRYLRKDGSLMWGNLSISLLNSRPSPLVLAMVEDVSEKKKTQEALARMSRKLIEAQEQERSRIARDLHDDIGQRLALLAVELERLQEDASGVSAQVSHRVHELRQQTIDVSTDVQTLSHELHSAKLEYLGVALTMKSWCKEFGERQKLEIEFTSHDVPRNLPGDSSLCLFRVLQEAVHNAAKHSGQKTIEVQLWAEPGEIHLVVTDMGKGFDVEAAMQSHGLGLTSMRERVRMVNGTLTIQTGPMGGNTIHARIPFSSDALSERAAG